MHCQSRHWREGEIHGNGWRLFPRLKIKQLGDVANRSGFARRSMISRNPLICAIIPLTTEEVVEGVDDGYSTTPNDSPIPPDKSGVPGGTGVQLDEIVRSASQPCAHCLFCFLRDAETRELLTVPCGPLCPSMALFATVCEHKGQSCKHTDGRLCQFLRASSATDIVY